MNWTKPVEIAPDVFWVGYVIPNDPFQCHVYLIKNGDESILIDPGSMITFPIVLEKITSIVPLHQIKYIIMHHQDPDIVGCFATLEKIMPNQEKYIVTHWRSQMLLKHYMWKTPFWLVDKNNWKLKAGDRELEFVFTPYAHFAGAFCTYDKKSGVLFSSDLFGGLTDEVRLFARDIGYFDDMKPFHQHYMPSKEVLRYAVSEINKKEPAMIAPQHGSIIRKNLIKPISDKLMDLDCGLYMLDEYESDIILLSKVDDVMRHFCKAIVSNSEFSDVLKKLFADIKEKSDSIKRIVICGVFGEKRIYFYANSRCRIKITDKNEKINSVFSQDLIHEKKLVGRVYIEAKDDSGIKMYKLLFDKIADPLAVRVEKDMELEVLEEQNKKLYEESIKDPLTNLFNRNYMEQCLSQTVKITKIQNRPLSMSMVDIDHFKVINDKYGHVAGDKILKDLSKLIVKNMRKSDIVIRYGGEEILIAMPETNAKDACVKMEHIRKIIEEHKFHENIKLTISAGVCEYSGTEVEEFVQKADKLLYMAKKLGRNRVMCQ